MRTGRTLRGSRTAAARLGAGTAVAWALAAGAPAATPGQAVHADSGYVRVEGPPVLVLHGGPSIGSGYLIEGFAGLSRDHRVILFDQRGIGWSTGAEDSTRLTVSRTLDDIDAVRETLVGGSVHLVGHSWGGLLALSYAIDRPGAVRSLVLVDPTEPGSRYARQRDTNLAAATTAVDSAELADLFASPGYRSGDPEVVESLYRAIYRPWLGHREAATNLRFGLDLEAALRGRRVGERLVRSPAGLARWTDLGRLIDVPTLIVHGDRDPIPVAMARRLHAEIDGSELVVLEGVGHFPMVEAPEAFERAVRGFIDGERKEDR